MRIHATERDRDEESRKFDEDEREMLEYETLSPELVIVMEFRSSSMNPAIIEDSSSSTTITGKSISDENSDACPAERTSPDSSEQSKSG